MASVPNRVYPLNEYSTISTTTLNTTTLNSTYSISNFNTGTTSGSVKISGFTAQGAIRQYQPVIFATVGDNSIYVSGACVRGQAGIIGVSATAVSTGGAVTIITTGLIPYVTSGSGALTKGGSVIYDTSGSKDCVLPLEGALLLSTGSYCVFGTSVITGASATGAVAQVWIRPNL